MDYYLTLLIRLACFYLLMKIFDRLGEFWGGLHLQDQQGIINIFSWLIVGGIVVGYISILKETDPELIQSLNQTLIERIGGN